MRRNAAGCSKRTETVMETVFENGTLDLSEICAKIGDLAVAQNIIEFNAAVEEMNAELARVPNDISIENVIGIVEFDIPMHFHGALESLQGSCESIPILRCIWHLTGFSASIAQLFSNSEFVDLFCKLLQSDISFDVTEPTLSSVFNVLYDCSETTVMEFLSKFNIYDMMCLIKKHEAAPNNHFVTLIRKVLPCFKRMSLLPLGEHGNHLLQAVGLLQELRARSDVLDTAIARHSMWIIYNMMESGTLDYGAFCELHLVELVNVQLTNPPVDVHGLVCQIISLLYANYDCQYCFDIDALFGYVLRGTMDRLSSPAIALGHLLKTHEDVIQTFDNTRLSKICQLVDIMTNGSMSTKSPMLRIISMIIRNRPLETLEVLSAGNRLSDVCQAITDMMANDEEETLVDTLSCVAALLETANEEGRALLASYFDPEFFEDLDFHADKGDEIMAMISHIRELLST